MIIDGKEVENSVHEVKMASDSSSNPESSKFVHTMPAKDKVSIENSYTSPNGDYSKVNGHKETCLANHSKSDIESDESSDNIKHLKCENGDYSSLHNSNMSLVPYQMTSFRDRCLKNIDISNDLKANLSENAHFADKELEIDYKMELVEVESNSPVSNGCEPYLNDRSNDDSPTIQIISLKLSDIKNNFSEFDGFMRLFFYISDVDLCEPTYETKSMDMIFTTKDEAFNLDHNKENFDNFAYKLSLCFRHAIVPEKCHHTTKKKSIEIHLQKESKTTWGAIAIQSDSATKSLTINQWTPCKVKQDGHFPNYSNNMMVVRYENSEEKLSSALPGKGRFYGYTGLDNLGNTCFMNSVLQCMSNTDPLRDYFLSNKYVEDINHSNPLGTGGVIVKSFAQFLNQMWMGKQSSFPPSRLKSLIGEKITSMFMGFNQHDAQEFMSFFLDAIHEDLNQNENKPKIDYNKENDTNEEKDLFDESDFINELKRAQMDSLLRDKADELWKQYLLFNNSIVINLFCGQFKSILTCPDCSKKSIMFDPFLYVPLPIPPPKIKYEVIFFARDKPTGMCKGSTSYTIKLPHSSTVSELLNIISAKTNVSTKSMRLIQQQEEPMPPKFLNPNWCLADYRSSFNDISNRNRPLLLFEVFKEENEEYTELCILQRSYEKLSSRRTYMSGLNSTRIGLPFIISVKKSMLSYSYLCSVICSYTSLSVSAYRVTLSENSFGANLSSDSVSSLVFHSDLFSFEKRPPSFDSNNRLVPHLIYFKSSTLHTNDILSPFLLRTPNFNGPNRNSEESEVVPPIITEAEDKYTSDDSDISDDSQSSTLKNSSNEETDSPLEKIDDSSDESDYKESIDEKKAPFKMAEYDNDAVLDLDNHFYLSVDWIDIKNFSSKISVRLLTNECQVANEVITSGDNEITLDDCLKLFNEPEVLGPQNCWRCPSCKDLREATKQLSFWRLPPILVIQLKRFKMKNVIYRDKISQFVKYPVNGLDLTNYQNDNLISCNGQKVKPIYDLYAVVNHMGDAFMGHYIAYARSFDGSLGWRNFDDCSVDNIDESRVVSPNAYLLFYKLRASE